jgi:hypothetical protein
MLASGVTAPIVLNSNSAGRKNGCVRGEKNISTASRRVSVKRRCQKIEPREKEDERRIASAMGRLSS